MGRTRLIPMLDAVCLAIIVAASAALRVSMVNKPIDYDEAYTYLFYASTPFRNALTSFGPGANNHLFHTLCAWVSTHALGASVATLRLPVLLAGIALPGLSYRLGRAVADRRTGLLAAALTGGSHALVMYSVNARGYGLQAALFVAALLAMRQSIERPSLARAAVLALLLALALFTVPTLILGAGSVFVWGGWRAARRRTQRVRRLSYLGLAAAITAVLTLLLYAPVLPAMIALKFHFAGSPRYGDLVSFGRTVLDYFDDALPGALGAIVLGVLGLGVALDLARRRLPLAALWLAVPIVMVVLHRRVSESAPFPRNFVFLFPIVFILAARAISTLAGFALSRRASSITCAGLALLSFAFTASHSEARYQAVVDDGYANARRVFDVAVVPMRAGDYLLVDGSMWDRLRFYAMIDGVEIGAAGRRRWELTVVRKGSRAQRAKSAGRVFVLDAKPRGRKLVDEWLAHHFGTECCARELRWRAGDSSVALFEVTQLR